MISRRQFVKSAAVVGAFTIVPRSVLGGPGHTPPSEKLNIAGVGVGGMGASDLWHCESENIVALCDVDEQYAAKTFEKYPKAKKYRDFRRMLDKQKDIDAVIISTPDHLHAVIAMDAMRRGKHVYLQKPLAHSVYEIRKLTEAARKYKIATQMGNQGNSSEGTRLICEWIWDGVIGKVREVHCWTDRPANEYGFPVGVERPKEKPNVPATLDWDLWIGPAPYRDYHPIYHPWKWRGWWDFGSGALGDMGCHIMESPIMALKLGPSVTVEASSTKVNSETAPVASIVRYKFAARGDDPAVTLTWYDGELMPERPAELEDGLRMGSKDGAMLFVGDKGKLMANIYGESPRLLPLSRNKDYPRPKKILPRSKGHYRDWIDACKGGKPAASNFEWSGPFTEIVALGNVAIRTGKKLKWDRDNMKITNVPEANQYLRTPYRQGWSL